MSFLLGLLKNPRFIAWAIAVSIMIGLFTYGKIQYVQVKSLESELAISEQNILTLEQINKAKDRKYQNLLDDIKSKEILLDKIKLDKQILVAEYSSLESKISSLLDQINNSGGPVEPSVGKIIERSVINSYSCIERAMGIGGALCE